MLAQLAERRKDVAGAPAPGEEELLLYRDRKLSPERRKEIRRMLVHDAELAATYLELVPRVTDEEKSRVWQRVVQDAAADEQVPSPGPLARSRRPASGASPSRRAPWSGWLAAGWLATALGLGAWVYVLEIRDRDGAASFASLSILAPGPRVGELLADDLISRSDAEVPVLTLRPGEEQVLLFLASAAFRYTDYRAELRAPDGETVGRIAGLTRRSSGQIVVSLAPGSLPAGPYELAVYGQDPAPAGEIPAGADLIGIYPFRLEKTGDE